MPNQYIIDYIRRNKDRFSFKVLREKLLKAGYPGYQIVEAEELVYKPKKISETPFWDFWHKKVYTSSREKLIDFIAGFVFAIILTYILGFGVMGYLFYYFGPFLYGLIFLALLIYFLIKRRFIGLGMICEIVLSFVFPIFSSFLYYF